MLRFDIQLLTFHLVPQNQKCVHFPRICLQGILHPETAPHKKLLHKRETFACYQRFRALISLRLLAAPHNALLAALVLRQESAAAFRLQAVLSAALAIPPGPVRELEVEGDYQFFLSFSSSPHSRLTAASASINNSSGPRSISAS